MRRPTTEEIAAWLADPAAHDPAPPSVEQFETHISHVFVAGEQVYKLKKPVRFEFLDYSTLERRRVACEDEVRLNRRAAPDLYLGVKPIVQSPDGRLALGGAGDVVDYVVVMRRLDLDRGLDRLIARDELSPEDVARLADWLAEFYRGRPPSDVSGAAYRASYERRVQANADDLLGLPGAEDVAQRVHQAQLAQLVLHGERFDARVAAGRVVEGHGDLRPDHVILPAVTSEPPILFDCVEFNQEFRTIDVVDELCFLAAECERLGAPNVGAAVLDGYYLRSNDSPPAEIVAFYESYRATVRAKVAHLRAQQLADAEAKTRRREAIGDLQLADRYAAAFHRPLCLVVRGASGVGKSTLAKALSARLRLSWLRTDEIRRTLEFSADERYQGAAREAVYETLFGNAAKQLAKKIGLVLDGTFLAARHAAQAATLAGAAGARLLVLDCTCSAETARARIAARRAAGRDPSEADVDLHDRQRREMESLGEEIPVTAIDAEAPLAEQIDAAISALREPS